MHQYKTLKILVLKLFADFGVSYGDKEVRKDIDEKVTFNIKQRIRK